MGTPPSLPRRLVRTVGGAVAGALAGIDTEVIVRIFLDRDNEGIGFTGIISGAIAGAYLLFALGHRQPSLRASVFSWAVVSCILIGLSLGYAVYPTVVLAQQKQPQPSMPSAKLRGPYEAKGIAFGVTLGGLAGALVGGCLVPFVPARRPSAVKYDV